MLKVECAKNCPRCLSDKTGIILYEFVTPKQKIAREMKARTYGTSVMFRSPTDYSSDSLNDNSFCEECGYTWFGETEFKTITKTELKEFQQSCRKKGMISKIFGYIRRNIF